MPKIFLKYSFIPVEIIWQFIYSFLDSNGAGGGGRLGSRGNSSYEGGERRMVDITRDKPIKVAVRVQVPVRDHPKVSYFCHKYSAWWTNNIYQWTSRTRILTLIALFLFFVLSSWIQYSILTYLLLRIIIQNYNFCFVSLQFTQFTFRLVLLTLQNI